MALLFRGYTPKLFKQSSGPLIKSTTLGHNSTLMKKDNVPNFRPDPVFHKHQTVALPPVSAV